VKGARLLLHSIASPPLLLLLLPLAGPATAVVAADHCIPLLLLCATCICVPPE
jgi:hypothetical protein